MINNIEAATMTNINIKKIAERNREKAQAYCDGQLTALIQAAAQDGEDKVEVKVDEALKPFVKNIVVQNGFEVKSSNGKWVIHWHIWDAKNFIEK